MLRYCFAAAALAASFTSFASPIWDLPQRFASAGISAEVLNLDLRSLRARYASDRDRFAAPIDVSFNSRNVGIWSVSEGQRLWQLAIAVPGTDSLSLRLKPSSWAAGTALIVETAFGGAVVSSHSYSKADLDRDGELWTFPAKGDAIFVSLSQPAATASMTLEVLQAFVGLGNPTIAKAQKQPGQTVNYLCRTTPANDGPARSVAMYVLNNQATCSGNLINNSSHDGRMLFMTARHCQVSGQQVSNFLVHWNETTPCGQQLGDAFDGPLTSSGAIHVADYQDGWLLQLTNPPPQSAHVYMAGFDASDAPIPSLYGVHHANHLDKQYYEGGAATKSSCDVFLGSTTVSAACWRTTPSDGTVDHGASGSAGFDANNRTVGPFSTLYWDNSGNVIAGGHQRLAALYDNGFAASLDPSGGTRVVDGMEYPGPFEHPPGVSISTSPSTVANGQFYDLVWSSTNATSCTASGTWGGSVPTSGSQHLQGSNNGSSDQTLTYTITCSNGAGSTTKSATETVTPPAAEPTVSINANPNSIPRTSTSTLTWSSTNATNCVASGDWSGNKPTSGSATVGPFAAATDRTYALTCTNSTGQSSGSSATLFVHEVAAITSFTASPTAASLGQSATLQWSTNSATTGCTASGDWSGQFASVGPYTTPPFTTARTYTYHLTCSNAEGDLTSPATATVVVSAQQPTASISADPSSIEIGQTSTLSWSSTNADNCTASGDWTGSKATSGSSSESPASTGNHMYTLTCTNSAGSAAATATVSVTSAPQPIVAISASPASIHSGQSSTLTWSSTNATGCTASGEWSGSKATSGQASVSPTTSGSHTYTLTCANGSGSASATTNVAVDSTPPPTESLGAAPTTISQGQSTTLSWTSSGATSCAASGEWSGPVATAGQSLMTPATVGDHAYVLSCSNSAGTTSSTTIVHVNPGTTPPPAPTVSLTASPMQVTDGGSTLLSWSTSNASSCSASGEWSGAQAIQGQFNARPSGAGNHVYSLTCSNSSGANSSTVIITVDPAQQSDPAVTLTASPTTINPGQSAILTWSSTNASTCTAGGEWSGSEPVNGQQSVLPNDVGNHSYTISCSNGAKSAQSTVTIQVRDSSSGSSGSTGGGSGGGALGGSTMVILLGLAARRRRHGVTSPSS